MKKNTKIHLPLIVMGICLYAFNHSFAQSSGINGKVKVIRSINGKTTTFEKNINEKNCALLLDSICKNMNIDIRTEKLGKNGKRVYVKSFGDCKPSDMDSLFGSLDMKLDLLIEDESEDTKTGKSKKKKVLINGFGTGKEDSNIDFRFSFDGDSLFTSYNDGDTETAGESGSGSNREEMVIIEKKGGKVKKRTIIIISDPEKEDLKKFDGLKKEEKRSEKLEVSDLKLYPNPTDGNFRLGFTLPEKGDVKISVTNIEGKEIYREELPDFEGQYEKQISLAETPTGGIYFLNIEQNGKQLFKKILKQ